MLVALKGLHVHVKSINDITKTQPSVCAMPDILAS